MKKLIVFLVSCCILTFFCNFAFAGDEKVEPVSSGASKSESALSPREVFEAFAKSIIDGYYEKAWGYLTKAAQMSQPMKEFSDSFRELMKDESFVFEVKSTKILDEKITGDEAILSIETTDVKGKKTVDEQKMLKEDGVWKIDIR